MNKSIEVLYQAWADEPYQAWADEPRKGEASQKREELEKALGDDDMLDMLYRYEKIILREAFEAGFTTARELFLK